MNQHTPKLSWRVFTIANQGLRKSFWMGLGIVFSLAIALATSVEYRVAFFRDPEGNILKLYQDL